MKKWWIEGLALALGLLVTGARGDDGWRQPPANRTPPAPAVVLDKPIVAGAQPSSAWAGRTAGADLSAPAGGPAVALGQPTAILGRPIPLGAGPLDGVNSAMVDPHLQRTTFRGSNDQNGDLVFRGQSPDGAGSKPMPMGPPSTDQSNQFAWQAASQPEQIHSPRSSTPLTSDGPPGVIVSNPHMGAPVFPDAESCSEECGTCPTVDGCPCGCGCYPGHRFYASAEYLGWFTKAEHLPPLLTTAASPDPTNNPRTGALDSPGTRVLYGDNNVAGAFRSGARIMTGYWFDDERCLGVELGGFFLQQQTDRFNISSNGNPLLYRPLVNADGSQGAELVSNNGLVPGQIIGTLSGAFSSVYQSSLWGAEANFRTCLLCGDDFFIDGIVGVKTLGLQESLTITENPVAVTDLFSATTGNLIERAGTSNPVQDRFKTKDQFYGGQVGVIGEYRMGPWSLDMKAKLGIGTNSQSIDISGFQAVIGPTGAVQASRQNGLYAAGTNIGHFSRNKFSLAPEVGLGVGYQVTDNIRAFVGYDFLYWTNVVRPATQINQVVNRQQVLIGGNGTGPVAPTFLGFKTEDFWAQGIKVGVEFRY
jgi:Putative beta barrel porin-7 (BBP7)